MLQELKPGAFTKTHTRTHPHMDTRLHHRYNHHLATPTNTYGPNYCQNPDPPEGGWDGVTVRLNMSSSLSPRVHSFIHHPMRRMAQGDVSNHQPMHPLEERRRTGTGPTAVYSEKK